MLQRFVVTLLRSTGKEKTKRSELGVSLYANASRYAPPLMRAMSASCSALTRSSDSYSTCRRSSSRRRSRAAADFTAESRRRRSDSAAAWLRLPTARSFSRSVSAAFCVARHEVRRRRRWGAGIVSVVGTASERETRGAASERFGTEVSRRGLGEGSTRSKDRSGPDDLPTHLSVHRVHHGGDRIAEPRHLVAEVARGLRELLRLRVLLRVQHADAVRLGRRGGGGGGRGRDESGCADDASSREELTARGREAPAGAHGTAEGRAVVARRVDGSYLVERHRTFVRHGARVRACPNVARAQRHTRKRALEGRADHDFSCSPRGKPRRSFEPLTLPSAAHDEHHRDPRPPGVHLHHRLRHDDPRPVAQLHDPSSLQARGPRRRPRPTFVPGASGSTFSTRVPLAHATDPLLPHRRPASSP